MVVKVFELFNAIKRSRMQITVNVSPEHYGRLQRLATKGQSFDLTVYMALSEYFSNQQNKE